MQNSWAMNVGFYETFVHTNENKTIRRGISLVIETVVGRYLDIYRKNGINGRGSNSV